MQDAAVFLAQKGLRLACYLDPEREAVLDADHGVRLNYEHFFFSDPALRAEFAADPTRTCGLLTDPVTKRRFLPRASSPRVVHEGVTFLFRTHATRERFRQDPERYARPGRRMGAAR